MGETTFYGLELATLPGLVMTPRQASEQLVTSVVDRLGERRALVADVGTGSGAIAVAIAVAVPRVHVWATDSSGQAVQLARANADRHGVGDRVTVRKGDLLEPVPARVDLIVANLPYLPLADAAQYPDLEQEPTAALFASGDGLEHYRRLVAAAEERLLPGGALVIQLHRRVLVAERDELDLLAARLQRPARRPLVAAAVASSA